MIIKKIMKLNYAWILFQLKNYMWSDKLKLKRFKDINKGKRCFIIGNGPSLSLDDLEMLKNEDTFAMNRIFKLYDLTDWRPKYYCSQDTKLLDELVEDLGIVCQSSEALFLNSYIRKDLENKGVISDNVNYVYVSAKNFYPNLPNFSHRIDKEIVNGYTVAYECIQLALYMGYKEIYFLGVDHNYNQNLKADGSIEKNENVSNYATGLEGDLAFLPQLEKSTLAFEKAKQVCEEKHVVIKNATRGGKLEVFERVDLDQLLKG